MSTLVYTPGVQIRIATAKEGIIDVSEDCASGSVTLNENELHSFDFNLLNHRRKYDGIFTPMDRVTIRMKRLRWMIVMSGYLSKVPYFTVFPETIGVSGACSLKRLAYYYWDPGTAHSQTLLSSLQASLSQTQDQGLKDLFIRLTTDVTGWEKEKIHVAQIPPGWFDVMQPVFEQVQADVNRSMVAGMGTSIQGGTIAQLGGSKWHPDKDLDPAANIGYLPAEEGKVSWFGGPRGNAPNGFALIPSESGLIPDSQRVGPGGPYYCAMRWPYARWEGGRNGGVVFDLSGDDLRRSIAWWKNRKILVFCPRTHKAVVVRAVDWGPASWAERIIDLSETALNSIGKTNDWVEVRFAPDDMPYGPVSLLGQATSGSSLISGALSNLNPKTGSSGWLDGGSGSPADTGGSTGPVNTQGIEFTANNNPPNSTGPLMPHAWAAYQFIIQNWPNASLISGRRNVNTVPNGRSYHLDGAALDIAAGNHGTAEGEAQATLDTIAAWFTDNPDVFGLKQVIWWQQINSGSGWHSYSGASKHKDHVHLSFDRDNVRLAMGPMGNGWPNDFSTSIGRVPGAGPLILASSLPGSFNENPASDQLVGPLALMNDTPFLEDLKPLIQASMRSFCSAPNGDLIAWFPDHFNLYGIAGKMTIKSMELQDLKISWSDDRMKTHQFVAGSNLGFRAPDGGSSVGLNQQYVTKGVASIDFPDIIGALFGVDSLSDATDIRKRILARFGARQEYTSNSVLVSGGPAEFWYATYKFMENWANMFSARPTLTFMPELFPGMLMEIPEFNLRLYTKSVTHTWDFRGGGFNTSVVAVAPSKIEGGPLYLPETLR